MTPGQLLKYSHPVDAAEASLRFILLADCGNRVHMELVCDWPLPPVECVATGEVLPADAPYPLIPA